MIKLTTKQLKLLKDVFNYALTYIEDTTETAMLFREGKDGKFEELKYKDFEKDVLELGKVLEEHIMIVRSDEGQA